MVLEFKKKRKITRSEWLIAVSGWLAFSILIFFANMYWHLGLKIWNCLALGAITGVIAWTCQSLFKDFLSSKHKIWFIIFAILFVIGKLVIYLARKH